MFQQNSISDIVFTHVSKFNEKLNNLHLTALLTKSFVDEEGLTQLKEMKVEIVELKKLMEHIKDYNIKLVKNTEIIKENSFELEALNDELQSTIERLNDKKIENRSLKKIEDPNKKCNMKENKSCRRSIEEIDENTFIKVPKHVKKRLTLNQINSAIQEINSVFQKKYSLVYSKNKKLSLKEQKVRGEYKKEALELKPTGYTCFINDTDLMDHSVVLRTKKRTKEDIVLLLRHLGKLKEIRIKSSIKYCIF